MGGHVLVVHRPCLKPLFILCDFPQTSSSVRGSHPWGLGQIYGDPPALGEDYFQLGIPELPFR